MKLKLAGCIAVLLVSVSGCSGDSNSGDDGTTRRPIPPPPPTVSPGGLWSGGLSWDPKDGFPGGTLNVRALVAETGEFRLVLFDEFDQRFSGQSEQIFGTFDIDGNDISTLGDAVWATPLSAENSRGDLWAWFGLAGDFAAGESISGTFQANGMTSEVRVGTLFMNYHSIYERPSSLGILQGTYRTPDEVLTIDGPGMIFYQSSATGCTGNGLAKIIDPHFNMYRVEIELGSCTGIDAFRNGLTYTGLANIGENNDLSGATLNETLEIAMSTVFDGGFGNNYLTWSLLAHKD